MYKGIDISRWQGTVNFEMVKASGIEFVIIKAGGSDAGFYTDKNFHYNVAEAQKAGLAVGAYYFVGPGCKSARDGISDAIRFSHIIKPYKFEYPVYIDFEAPDASNKQGNTEACIGFCRYMESLGYYAGIYASDISGFKDRLNISQLNSFDKWVARYGSQPKYVKNWGVWQSGSNGIVPGISTRVDTNESKNNYPQIMKTHHLNGY